MVIYFILSLSKCAIVKIRQLFKEPIDFYMLIFVYVIARLSEFMFNERLLKQDLQENSF